MNRLRSQKSLTSTSSDTLIDVRLADFNGDGHLDLVALFSFGSNQDGVLAVRRGISNGTFEAPAVFPTITGPSSVPLSFIVGPGASSSRSATSTAMQSWTTRSSISRRTSSRSSTASASNHGARYGVNVPPQSVALYATGNVVAVFAPTRIEYAVFGLIE